MFTFRQFARTAVVLSIASLLLLLVWSLFVDSPGTVEAAPADVIVRPSGYSASTVLYHNDLSGEVTGYNVTPLTMHSVGVVDAVGAGFATCPNVTGRVCFDLLATGQPSAPTVWDSFTMTEPSFVRMMAMVGGSGRGVDNHFTMWLTDFDGRPVTGCVNTWSVTNWQPYGEVSLTCALDAGYHELRLKNVETGNMGVIFGEVTVETTYGEVVSLAITPSVMSLTVNTSAQVGVVGYDQFGVMVPSFAYTLTASAGGFTDTVYTAPITSGNYVITATAGNVFTTAMVHALPDAAVEVTLFPVTYTGPAGSMKQFVGYTYDQWGNHTNEVISYVGSAGVEVDATGMVTLPTTVGYSTVSARVTNQTGMYGDVSWITTVPAALHRVAFVPSGDITGTVGTTRTLSIKGYDMYGNEISIIPWFATTCGSVNNSVFEFPEFPWDCVITAGYDVFSTSITAHAVVGNIARVEITPKQSALNVGQTQQFGGKAYDSKGNEVAFTPIYTATAGIIDGSGLYTATTAGHHTITLAGEIYTDTAHVDVFAKVYLPLVIR